MNKFLSGLGQTGLVAGSGFIYLLVFILRFVFVALVGLSVIWISIQLFMAGSILWGILVLIIGAPLAIGLSSYFFPFLLCLTILTAIVWGCIRLFGGTVSFSSIWDGIWLVMQVLITGGMAIFGLIEFVQSIKNKAVGSFFKEYWGGMILFMFLLWLFFLK